MNNSKPNYLIKSKQNLVEIFFYIAYVKENFSIFSFHLTKLYSFYHFFFKTSNCVLNFNTHDKKRFQHIRIVPILASSFVPDVIQGHSIFKTLSPQVSFTNSFFLHKVFNLLFLFNYFALKTDTKLNAEYRILFLRLTTNFCWVNGNQFLNLWMNGFAFIYNILYYNLNPLIFGSPVFKKEVLAFNWKASSHDIQFWKISFLYFIFKTNTYDNRIVFFYKQLRTRKINFILMTDCFYHYKNLYYFRKLNFYVLGLASSSLNPWLLAYALPSLSNTFFAQFFFLKIIMQLGRFATKTRFEFYQKLWNNLLTKTSSNLNLKM